jgi:hypothetical protein
MIIHIKKLNILRIILLRREMTVRGYKDIFCENGLSNLANLRPRESLANSIRFAGGSVEIRRCPI